jgi:riboflavin synthase
MFTGLIETTGTLLAAKSSGGAMRLVVAAPQLAGRWRIGDSIAVNGVCLTALDMEDATEAHPGRFAADLAQETIERTSLADLQTGALLNLELPTPAGSPLGGHVVQGHVDATGTLISLEPVDPDADRALTDWWLRVEVPEAIRPYMVEKGSVAIEGISLTIARWDGEVASAAIIPHTYSATNLHTLAAGSSVNLEADVLAKLAVQHQRERSTFELTVDYLVANGY